MGIVPIGQPTMATNDPDLETLIRMLGQCLGRIDEQAYRVQVGEDDFQLADHFEDETALLQELVDSLLVVEAADDSGADVNEIVERVLQSCLNELDVPIVIHSNLTTDDSRASAPRALVTVAVQRALELALAPLRPGDELRVTTRRDNDDLLIELEAIGSEPAAAISDRAETLREFVGELGGTCELRCEQAGSQLLMLLGLPRTRVTDRSETDGFA